MVLVPGFFPALLIGITRAGQRLAAAWANRRAAQELTHWDQRALKDIGLTPGDVDGALSLPFHRDPTYHLAQVAAGRSPLPRLEDAGPQEASHSSVPRGARPGDLPSAGPALCA